MRDVDANLVLEEEVEEVLLSYIDEFIDRVLRGACTLAKHRQENTIDVKDVQQFISKFVVFVGWLVFVFTLFL